MTCKSLCLIALTLASIVPSTSFATPRQRPAHAREFFAHAPDADPVSLPQREPSHSDCFKALTPVEMNRGIRHWTGNC